MTSLPHLLFQSIFCIDEVPVPNPTQEENGRAGFLTEKSLRMQ